MDSRSRTQLVKLVWLCIVSGLVARSGATTHDYGRALKLSFHFFEAQRSGYLPVNQRVRWRANSALRDGFDSGVDLVGGYYDAGDNVKFQFPMAYTITALSWSAIEYRRQLENQKEFEHALDAIKWGTDYFIKAHPQPCVLWVEVGDGDSDHECWQRPEDMTTSRRAYKIDPQNPGSEVAAETAAAMAAASIVFQTEDMQYSATLLFHARQLFDFADTYRGSYSDSIPVVENYYGSGISKFEDELLWAALWLFEATEDEYYLEYATRNSEILGGTVWAVKLFSWDIKYPGLQVLASKILLQQRGKNYTTILEAYQKNAEFFLCSSLNRMGEASTERTAGGMLWYQAWNNMQYVTSAAFLVTLYADLMASAGQNLVCAGEIVPTWEVIGEGKAQIDYILGSNPLGMSYMVGYGPNFPTHVHHRGASIVSFKQNSSFVGCLEGYRVWYEAPQKDPNVLAGAVVGGPTFNDTFLDRRDNWDSTEACIYNNAFLVGALARLTSG